MTDSIGRSRQIEWNTWSKPVLQWQVIQSLSVLTMKNWRLCLADHDDEIEWISIQDIEWKTWSEQCEYYPANSTDLYERDVSNWELVEWDIWSFFNLESAKHQYVDYRSKIVGRQFRLEKILSPRRWVWSVPRYLTIVKWVPWVPWIPGKSIKWEQWEPWRTWDHWRDGSCVLFGKWRPRQTDGKDWDVYIDRNRWDVYSKQDDKWEVQGCIKWDKWDRWEKWEPGKSVKWEPWKSIKWDKWEPGESIKWETGEKWDPWRWVKWKWEWSSAEKYEENDLVRHDRAVWICTKENINREPGREQQYQESRDIFLQWSI